MYNLFIKLFDRNHKEILAEIYTFTSNVFTYTKTLNGIGNMQFSVPFTYLEENKIEIISGQCCELYEIVDNKEVLLWYGNVSNPCPGGVDINVTCLGYLNLFMNRKFTDMAWDDKDETWKETFYNKKYGQLISYLIDRINAISFTGITIGNIEEGTLTTDRVINWSDDLKEKIDEFIEDSGYYFNIDKDRKFNFYSTYGTVKDYYEINDYNIVGEYDATIDQTQIYNRILGRVVYKDEDDVIQILQTVQEDEESIKQYGLKEYVYTNSEIRLLSTLQEQCKDFLEMYKRPLTSFTLEVKIDDIFNIYDIEPGDYINFNSNKYQYNGLIRVMEYEVDKINEKVKITIGNSIFREKALEIYRYK